MSYNNRYENDSNGLLIFCIGVILILAIMMFAHIFVFDEDWQTEHKENNPELYINE